MFNLSIGAIYRNESSYLKEWIEYHLFMGIDYFWLYDNNDSGEEKQKSLDIISEYKNIEIIDWSHEQTSPQITAYRHIVDYTKNKTKWLALIDIDEFIAIKNQL